ncbi:DUF6415 family natural product biosynthesis protein [Streptomyces sp. NPDC012623]|uniref:DUF6415 family natural product biosynthesis protein n=1 Tax=unclassified Streptomyces TaxID=2593676 RepID=UPI0036AD20E1
MAPLTPAVPDEVEILAKVDMTLARNLEGPDLPAVDISLAEVEQFIAYGRTLADELRTLVLSISADSDAWISAQATLSESVRRLHLAPPPGTPHAAARRAQNLARLVKGLLRSAGRVTKEQTHTTHPQLRHATTRRQGSS